MENKELHIENFSDLLEELKTIKTNDQKKLLVECLKQTQTNDTALEGAILFLKDNHWNIEQIDPLIYKFNTIPQENSKKITLPKRKLKTFRYAGVLVILLGLISFYYFTQTSTSLDEFYVEEPGLPNFMSDTKTTKWTNPMVLFKNGNYEKALTLLNASSIDKNNDTLLFYKAISNYKLKDYKKSLDFFKENLKNQKSSFYYDTEFRIGFSLYKLGYNKQAKQQFINIGNNKNHPFNKEAVLILKNIF